MTLEIRDFSRDYDEISDTESDDEQERSREEIPLEEQGPRTRCHGMGIVLLIVLVGLACARMSDLQGRDPEASIYYVASDFYRVRQDLDWINEELGELREAIKWIFAVNGQCWKREGGQHASR